MANTFLCHYKKCELPSFIGIYLLEDCAKYCAHKNELSPKMCALLDRYQKDEMKEKNETFPI